MVNKIKETMYNRHTMINSPIESRNTGKGKPSAITHIGISLNKRQQKLLDNLKGFDDVYITKKHDVSMKDLSALTAKEGVEFALFTKGGERMVVRGGTDINGKSIVNIDINKAKQLNADGWRWSGHTHPGVGTNVKIESIQDIKILKEFTKQIESVIYDIFGNYRRFDKV